MSAAEFRRAAWRSGTAVSFLLSLVACGAVLAARLTRGGPAHAWLTTVLLVLAAIVGATSVDVFVRGEPRPAGRLALAAGYVGGAVLAVGSVHLALGWAVARSGGFDRALIEAPAQLTNDAVLVVVMLALAWSLGARSRIHRVGVPALCMALVVAYLSTASHWHVDAFAGFAVQRFVAVQACAMAGALVLFDVVRPRVRRT